MNLRDRQVERAIWSRVRRELRASPALWAEYRRARTKVRRRLGDSWLVYLLIPAFGYFWIQGLIDVSGEVWPALAVVAFWFLGVTGSSALGILTRLYDGVAVAACCHLPLTDAQVFETRWHGQFRRALWVSLLYLPVGMAMGGHGAEGWGKGLLLTVLPSCQYLLAFAGAVHLAAWAPGWGRTLFLGGCGSALVLLWGGSRYLDRLGPVVEAGNWLPPFGWFNQAVYRGVMGGEPMALVWLAPLVVLLLMVPRAWRRLRDDYRLGEPAYDPTGVGTEGDMVGAATGPPAESWAGGEVAPLATGVWEAELGWIERWVYRRCWTPREREVAEFLLGETREWTGSFGRLVWAFPVAVAAILGLGAYGPTVVFLAILFTVSLGVPLFGGRWRGFDTRPTGGMFSPVHAVYPIGFGEMVWVMLKANLVRVFLGAPFVMALAALGSWRLTGDLGLGLGYALKATAVYLTAMPVILVLRYSAATNDTQRPRLWLILVVSLLTLVSLAAGFWVFVAAKALHAGLGLVVGACANVLILAVYGWAWNHGRFDLLTHQAEDGLNQ
jgi:hypothetical protein